MEFAFENAIERFLKEKGDEAIQIQLTERTNNGRGIFMVDFLDELNVDCCYLPVQDDNFPREYVEYIRSRIEDPRLDSVLFFLFCYKDKSQLLELNLDSNSTSVQEIVADEESK